jgi:tetratricopeptide (TPR) repeat protein
VELRSGPARRGHRTLSQTCSPIRRDGDNDKSLAYLELAKTIDPDDYDLRHDLAQAKLDQDRVEEAVAELFELATLYLVESSPEKGFRVLNQISELDPNHSQRHIRIGQCLESAGFEDEALKGYLRFISHMQESGMHEAALLVCEAAGASAPLSEELLDARIASSLELERKDEALTACREMARACVAKGDDAKAEEVLMRGIRIDRTDASIKADLAQMMERNGRTTEAVELWIEVALYHRVAGRNERTLQAAREALRIAPDNTEAKGLVAEEYEKQGQIGEALSLWKSMAHQLLGEDSDSVEALRILEHAIEIAPTDLAVLAAGARLKARISGPLEARPLFENWLGQANSTANPADQLDAYQQAVEHYPDVLDYRSQLADLYIERGTTDEAMPHLERLLVAYRAKSKSGADYLATLERAVELFPQRLDLRTEWAEALAGIGELERSGAIFSDVARHLLAAGDHKAGLQILNKSLQYQPENRDLLAQIAELHEGFGSPPEALRAWERIADLNRRAGDSQRNLPVLRKLLQLRPDDLNLRLELGGLYEEVGPIEDAVTTYFKIAQIWSKDRPKDAQTLEICEKVVALAPDFLEGRQLLVQCLLAQGDRESAKTHLDQVAEIALAVGNLAQAEQAYKRIQELDPADIASGERLGRLYEARGQNEDAAAAYRAVLAIYRQQGIQERIVSVLRKMKGLTPRDLEARLELARALGEMPEAADETCEEWFELISLALSEGETAIAESATRESAPLFVGQWDHRFALARLFAEKLDDREGAEAWKRLAGEALEAGSHTIARNAASEGLCLTPADITLREIRIESSRQLGDSEVAENDLKILVEECIGQGEYASAERYLVQVIELRPDDTELIDLLTETQIAQEHTEDAIETLHHLAEIYRKGGDLKRAINKARRILELDGSNIGAMEYLAQLLVESNKSAEATAIWKDIARQYLSDGKPAEALRRYEAVLTQSEHDIEALRNAADLTLQVKGAAAAVPRYERLLEVMTEDAPLEEAESEFERVIRSLPEELPLAGKYAAFLHKAGKTREAEDEFVRITRTYLNELKDPERALATIRTLGALDPENLAVLREEAAIREAQGNTTEAATLLRTLADAYRNIGRREDAVLALAHRAEMLADDAQAQVDAAEAHEELGDYGKATALLLRGVELHERQKTFASCIPLLKQASLMNPDRADLKERLGELYDQTGQTENAIEHWLETGQWHEAQGHTAEAVRHYRHLKSLTPENYESRRRLARIAEDEGDFPGALSELRDWAVVTFQRQDHEQAIEVLRRIRALDPEDTDSRVALVQEYAAIGHSEQRYEALCDLEEHYCRIGELQRAVQVLNELKELRPQDLDLTLRSIDLMVKAGDIKEAVQAGIDLLELHLQAEDVQQAAQAARRVTAIVSDDIDLRLRIVSIVREHDQKALALQEIVRGHDELWAEEKGSEALALCEAGIQVFPDETSLQKLLIKTLIRLRQHDRAVQEQLRLAAAFESKGQDEAANEIYDQILTAHPEHIETHEACVNIALKQGDLARTSDHLTRLAEIHVAAGRVPEAIESLERLIELEPSQKEFLLRLAELYFDSGQADRARSLWLSTARDLQVSGELPSGHRGL